MVKTFDVSRQALASTISDVIFEGFINYTTFSLTQLNYTTFIWTKLSILYKHIYSCIFPSLNLDLGKCFGKFKKKWNILVKYLESCNIDFETCLDLNLNRFRIFKSILNLFCFFKKVWKLMCFFCRRLWRMYKLRLERKCKNNFFFNFLWIYLSI